MQQLELVRFAYTYMGTFGTIQLPEGVTLYTVERPWLDNKPSVSCIPTGEYKCVPRKFFRGGYDAVHVTNVPDRSHILFHIGNTMDDLEGCIALGVANGWVKGKWAVTASKNAFALFMELFGHSEFQLTISEDLK